MPVSDSHGLSNKRTSSTVPANILFHQRLQGVLLSINSPPLEWSTSCQCHISTNFVRHQAPCRCRYPKTVIVNMFSTEFNYTQVLPFPKNCDRLAFIIGKMCVFLPYYCFNRKREAVPLQNCPRVSLFGHRYRAGIYDIESYLVL